MSFRHLLHHPAVRCAFALSLGVPAWTAQAADSVINNLPNLSSAKVMAPGHFSLAADSASIGYETRLEKWGAKFDRYLNINPALRMDYGRLLTDSFGAGGTFTRQSDYSEIVVNGIYSPKRNLRFRMTGAQLRTTGSELAPDNAAFMQNSYLLGAKKVWENYEYLSDLGVTAYSVEASAPPAANLFAADGEDALDGGSLRSGAIVPGRLDGYMLNLGLRPTARSKLELRRESSNLTHTFDASFTRQEQLVSNQVKYSHYLGGCTRLQGGYSAGEDFGRIDLKLTKNNWNVRLWREQESGGNNTAIQFGYALPLGRRAARTAADCGTRPGAPVFEPIVDAARQRPAQIPRDPLPAAVIP